jgi:hypothetical protein
MPPSKAIPRGTVPADLQAALATGALHRSVDLRFLLVDFFSTQSFELPNIFQHPQDFEAYWCETHATVAPRSQPHSATGMPSPRWDALKSSPELPHFATEHQHF